MKRVLIVSFLFITLHTKAQFFSDYTEKTGTVRLGAGYTHDFPGLNGYTVGGEFSKSMSDNFQGAIGVKHINLAGYPRTQTVNEFTKATTIDFNIYFVPVQSSSCMIRLGAGYAFSFYKIRRSYPIVTTHGVESTTNWPVEETKGRTSGISLVGEYEYLFPESNFSIGLRAALYKAYDRISYIGPFVGIKL